MSCMLSMLHTGLMTFQYGTSLGVFSGPLTYQCACTVWSRVGVNKNFMCFTFKAFLSLVHFKILPAKLQPILSKNLKSAVESYPSCRFLSSINSTSSVSSQIIGYFCNARWYILSRGATRV